jgi:hypothetical protein
MRSLLVCLLACLALPASAGAIVDLSGGVKPVRGNPADKLASLPIEGSTYDPATKCSKAAKPGMTRLVAWMQANVKGATWGTYRCEKWGKGSASLHAEGRALDWHLDVAKPAERREAERFIRLLLAPDKAGNPQALARRMGVEELIWDCGYWMAGMREFKRYGACTGKNGAWKKKVDKTIAHRDHVHIGLTKKGAAAKTSFWTRRAASEDAVGTPPQRSPRPQSDDRDPRYDPDWSAPRDDIGAQDEGGAAPSSAPAATPEPTYEPDPDAEPWDDPDSGGGADPYDDPWN